jgi:hypothetical protein
MAVPLVSPAAEKSTHEADVRALCPSNSIIAKIEPTLEQLLSAAKAICFEKPARLQASCTAIVRQPRLDCGLEERLDAAVGKPIRNC